jgi:methylthioribose-1-phosphate isomerase
MSIRTIFWESDAVVMIDQKALPLEERYLTCKRYEDVIMAIKDLTVRGAPAIGVAAAMGIALGTLQISTTSTENLKEEFYHICDYFSQTRPTARNLFWAIDRMKKRFEGLLRLSEVPGSRPSRKPSLPKQSSSARRTSPLTGEWASTAGP